MTDTIDSLRLKLTRQQALLANPSLLAGLPDKGQKVRDLVASLEAQIAHLESGGATENVQMAEAVPTSRRAYPEPRRRVRAAAAEPISSEAVESSVDRLQRQIAEMEIDGEAPDVMSQRVPTSEHITKGLRGMFAEPPRRQLAVITDVSESGRLAKQALERERADKLILERERSQRATTAVRVGRSMPRDEDDSSEDEAEWKRKLEEMEKDHDEDDDNI
eukprot:TRINITY_DN15957_c0_g1_i1.p1 TRINITY_DN15957_c0_g1~~TRINITY_DN15957_c0_g1_i1.p1  ORF type:complete len:219 (+),score=27.24 TRINITY_DN15957_c0_g1_i1:69-725(+)